MVFIFAITSFYAFEELIHSWNKKYYKFYNRKKASKKIEKCLGSFTELDGEELRKNRGDDCELKGFSTEIPKKCKIHLSSYSRCFADSLKMFMPYTFAGNNFHRLRILDSTLLPLSRERLKKHLFNWDFELLDNCVIYFKDYYNVKYSNIYFSNYSLINSSESTELAWNLIQHWCGGRYPLDYFSRNHFPSYNKKIYDLFITNGCNQLGALSNVSFLLEAGDSLNRKQFIELYNSDIENLATKEKEEGLRIIDSYRVFDNYLEGDSLVYVNLVENNVNDILLNMFKDTYLDNDSRQIKYKVNGKYE